MAALWEPEIQLDDDGLFLSFRDLIEIRVADALISAGLSPQKMRRIIQRAREVLGESYPLSSARFRTDGHAIFLSTLDESGDEKLLDVLENQYAFQKILEPLLRDIEFSNNVPSRWWPMGQKKGIVVDPARAFGQPIDNLSGVPTRILTLAVRSEGSPEAAARAYHVPIGSVRNAMKFEARLTA